MTDPQSQHTAGLCVSEANCNPPLSALEEHNENLPKYSLDGGQLLPTTPMQNDRYTRIFFITPEYTKIPRGLHTALLLPEPPYLAPDWTSYVNPEGSPFYVNHAKHIVTDDPIQHADICNKILSMQRRLEAIIRTEGLQLPEEYECYITANPSSDRCKYYCVDHTTQTVFWLEEIDPDLHDLDLAPVCSMAQMKYLLQEQYWVHQEYFPHRPVPLMLKKELIDIFRQARADQLTSELSTFPYNAQQCKEYLQIIDIDSESSSHMTWTIARLWGATARHKYDTFFGEDHARISRDQSRYDKPAPKRTIATKLCSALLFNLPQRHAAKLDMLSSDNLAYTIHWRADFASVILREWQESSYLAVGLLMIGAISLSRPLDPISVGLGSVSVVLALSGMISSVALLQWYDGAEKFTASYVAAHLGRVYCPTRGYEPIAQVYSAPRALVFWSILFLALHMLSAVVDFMGLIVQTPAIVLAGIIFVAFCQMYNSLHDGFCIQPEKPPLRW